MTATNINPTIASLTTIPNGTSSAGDAVVNGGAATTATLTVNNSTADTYAGTIGGTGTNQNLVALVKTGAGTLTLSGNNTYTGGTTLNNGIVNVASAGALGTSAIGFTGGTLQYSATGTTDYSNQIAGSSSAISIDTNSQSVTYASAIAASNSGGLTKLGAGTLTFTGNNAYTGATTISTGTLAIGTGGGILGNITDNSVRSAAKPARGR